MNTQTAAMAITQPLPAPVCDTAIDKASETGTSGIDMPAALPTTPPASVPSSPLHQAPPSLFLPPSPPLSLGPLPHERPLPSTITIGGAQLWLHPCANPPPTEPTEPTLVGEILRDLLLGRLNDVVSHRQSAPGPKFTRFGELYGAEPEILDPIIMHFLDLAIAQVRAPDGDEYVQRRIWEFGERQETEKQKPLQIDGPWVNGGIANVSDAQSQGLNLITNKTRT
ncbi:hypothetical protein VTI74DRAFT_10433 [Chaetomium olivicolor]